MDAIEQMFGCSTDAVKEAFWNKVEKSTEPDGCWLWKSFNGAKWRYAAFTYKGVSMPAHRFSYMLVHGLIPKDMVIRHQCDVPACVNPAHLLLGTHAENTHDKVLRGRCQRKADRGPLWPERADQEAAESARCLAERDAQADAERTRVLAKREMKRLACLDWKKISCLGFTRTVSKLRKLLDVEKEKLRIKAYKHGAKYKLCGAELDAYVLDTLGKWADAIQDELGMR